MSVFIPSMEMPEYCYECPCHNGESGYCQLYKDRYLSSIYRPAKCPLVEIKTPHGRLIDADYLLSLMDNGDHYPTGLLDAADIYYAPTIIESEEDNNGN